jgi:hypothetical protein
VSGRRSHLLCAAIVLLLVLASPVSAKAAFSIESFTPIATKLGGIPETQAGAHPYSLQAGVELGTEAGAQRLRDLTIHMPPGVLINPSSVDECTEAAFQTPRSSTKPGSLSGESCPNPTQVGVIQVDVGGTTRWFGLFSIVSPFGSVAALGASPFGTPLVFKVQDREADSGLDLVLEGVPQTFDLRSFHLVIWGTPWNPPPPEPSSPPPPRPHDDQRGNCLDEETGGSLASNCQVIGPGIYVPKSQIKSYVTLPTTPCGIAPAFQAQAESWAGEQAEATATIAPLVKCNKAKTIVSVKLMTNNAVARTGMEFNLDVNDGGGILNPEGIARPALKTAIATLPEGLTINPSLGAGLGTCTEAEFARETAGSEPGAGCPNSSKIGDATAEGVLGLAEPLKGGLYLATPHANPFDALIAVYIVARSARRGIILKSLGHLDPDPHDGRLIATFDQLPRLLYTRFSLTLREGQRSTLVSPPVCGTYRAGLQDASWAEPEKFTPDSSYFLIEHGEGGGPCPEGGVQPFQPGLLAGSLNPRAGVATPFYLRMTRTDAEQEITSYSATFPPGMLAKLAGVGVCPDSALEAAKTRSGTAELASPSCPASSQVGHTEAGYGVGGVLAWAPGNLYLAGPYHGAPLSIAAVDSALIGPFDLGTVIVRSAIRVDPTTAQAQIDSLGSDPIPHILDGIPLHLRDIRVYVDRPDFTITPTSCDPSSVSSLLTGAGKDLFSAADDVPATTTQRYQLLGCSALDFRPRLRFNLNTTGQRRFPALRSEYRPRPGDANTHFVSVTLPRSLFVAQSHLKGICTKVQFAAEACPPDSVYGHARAITPLLDAPLEGNVYLRSANPLPNIVFALRGDGGLKIDVVGRIDTVHGATRVTFTEIPDAPLTKFVLSLEGGRGSLLELTQEACSAEQFANARMIGHNNLGAASKPAVRVRCNSKKTKGTKAK